jgi:hypothetical protein
LKQSSDDYHKSTADVTLKDEGNMTRAFLSIAVMAAVCLGAHEAFAQLAQPQQICIFGICFGGGGGGGHPAPAPLLAAGIPAFVVIGGGLLASRLYKKFRRRG